MASRKPTTPSTGVNKNSNTQRLLAIGGIIGPILFTTVVFILGILRPGYSHISQAVSELGEVGAPNAIIQDINFFVLGLLVLGLALGLHREIGGGMGSKIGPVLLVFFALVAGVGNGIFPCDVGCEFVTFTGTMHNVTGLTGFIAFAAAALILPRRLKTDNQWQGFGNYSRISGVLALFFLVFWISEGFGALPSLFGVLQRLMITVMFLWIEVMAVRLFLLSGRSPK